jgi:hypothetical protein
MYRGELHSIVGPEGQVIHPGLRVLTDSSGQYFSPESLAHTLAYNGDGKLETDTCTDGEKTWVQTFTYEGDQLVGISAWVRQA